MGSRKAVKSPGSGIMDRLLVPRLLSYASNNSLSDLDEVTSALRQLHKEYQRKQTGPFRQMVAKAIKVVQAKGAAKPDLQLLAIEDRHLAARQAGPSGRSHTAPSRSAARAEQGNTETGNVRADGGRGSGSSDSDSGSDAEDTGSEDLELDFQDGRPAIAVGADGGGASQSQQRAKGVNNLVLSMYAKGAAGAGADGESGAALAGRSTEPPAFAAPELVAAAAARAIAASKEAARAGMAQQTPDAGRAGTANRSDAVAKAEGDSQRGLLTIRGKQALALEEPAKDKSAVCLASAVPPGPSSSPSAPNTSGAPCLTGQAVVAVVTHTTTVTADKQAALGLEGMEAAGAQQSDVDGSKSKRGPPSDVAGRQNRLAQKKARRSSVPGLDGAAAKGGGRGGGSSALTAAKAVRYADLGGIEEVLGDIREIIEYPLKHPEVYAWLGVEPPRGVLLHGPPGCGKTALANAIANECGVPFLRVSAPEIVSGMSGESEAKLRGLFQEAQDVAPCIVFIDEIDAIFPKRESAQREMERRIVAQMLTCMDDLSAGPQQQQEGEAGAGAGLQAEAGPGGKGFQPHPHVIVIGATNRPDALDTALRRAGRFDREISLGIPTEAARVKILQVISRRLRLEGDFDFHLVAKRTPGFVGADLNALCKEAAAIAVTRIFRTLAPAPADQQQTLSSGLAGSQATGEGTMAPASHTNTTAMEVDEQAAGGNAPRIQFGEGPLGLAELSGLSITMSDFTAAIHKVQPSVRREGFTTTPDVTWEDVGSLDEIREELFYSITQPIKHPERFAAMGLAAAAGVLLYGPPGCGKTLVAKAVANDAGANFISIKGPELLNKYVGESERAVRVLFSRARAAQPCVLFFDEMDALAPRRGTDTNQAAERVVNQLLTEMDGMDGRQGVFLVAATNRPDMIDPALLRPGRLDKVLYVPLPPPAGRASILAALTRRVPLAAGADLAPLAMSNRCDGFSGADMAALVREACIIALKESIGGGQSAAAPGGTTGSFAAPCVEQRHFEAALSHVGPSVSVRDQRTYDNIRTQLRAGRPRGPAQEADKRSVSDLDAAAAAQAAGDAAAAPPAPSENLPQSRGDLRAAEDLVALDGACLQGGIGGLGAGCSGITSIGSEQVFGNSIGTAGVGPAVDPMASENSSDGRLTAAAPQ